MPPRQYKKAHRHASDAFILILSGKGFSLTWPEGAYHKRERIDWRPGTLFVPPTFWYHQHLNLSAEPARYLAINQPKIVRNLGLRFADQLEVDLDAVREEWRRALEELDSRAVPPTP
jgi:gentisate 1,2-dioxygenase